MKLNLLVAAIAAQFDTRPINRRFGQVFAIAEPANGSMEMPLGCGPHFYPKNFSITEGKPKTYKSSDWAEVGFCENCGTPLTFRFLEQLIKSNKNLDFIGITVGSLDNPENLKPASHNHVDSKLSWLPIDESLPQHVSAIDTVAREIDI